MNLLTALVDIFFPPRCLGCKRENTWICPVCLKKVNPEVHSHPHLPDVFFLSYLEEGPVRPMVHALKYEGIPETSFPFFLYMRAAMKEWVRGLGVVCFIPVPISKSRRKKRGYNQAGILVKQIAQLCGGCVWEWALGKYEGKTLVGEGKEERGRQAQELFYWNGKPPPPADTYIVVDDVLTTGSTMQVCMEILKKRGLGKVVGLAVAHER